VKSPKRLYSRYWGTAAELRRAAHPVFIPLTISVLHKCFPFFPRYYISISYPRLTVLLRPVPWAFFLVSKGVGILSERNRKCCTCKTFGYMVTVLGSSSSFSSSYSSSYISLVWFRDTGSWYIYTSLQSK